LIKKSFHFLGLGYSVLLSVFILLKKLGDLANPVKLEEGHPFSLS
jgi:hypothetical protein